MRTTEKHKKAQVIIEPEYYQGSEELMSCELTQVTEWLPDKDFEWAIKLLRRDRIKWVIMKKELLYQDRGLCKLYALFRKKLI